MADDVEAEPDAALGVLALVPPPFEWLEQAYGQRDGGLSEIKEDPLLKNLETDPRWAAFLKKMRLPLD